MSTLRAVGVMCGTLPRSGAWARQPDSRDVCLLRSRTTLFLVLTMLVSAANPTVAQDPPLPPLPAEPAAANVVPLENAARILLDRAEALLASGVWDEALETYRRVIAQYGDRLIVWPDGEGVRGFGRLGPVRELAWMRLATLQHRAPEVLAGLRRQIDGQAKRWLENPPPDDEESWRRITDELFLSSWGDDALLRLGDAALERGHPEQARRHWERLAPGLRFVSNNHPVMRLAGERPLWLPFLGQRPAEVWPEVADWFEKPDEPRRLVYPDTDLDLAAVRARLALASLLEGNLTRAEIEVDILAQLAPAAAGKLGAREGNLVELMRQLVDEARLWPAPRSSRDWATFAGDVSRQRVAPPIASVTAKPLWSVPLPRRRAVLELASLNRSRVAEDSDGILAYFPLVLGDWAVVQTGPSRWETHAFQLDSGEAMLPAVEDRAATRGERRNYFGVPRFVPAAMEKTLFISSGESWLSLGDDGGTAQLEAIDLEAERKLLWTFSPAELQPGTRLVLAGPPATDGSRLFMPLRARESVRDALQLAALDRRDGRVLWRQTLGGAEPAANPAWMERSHQLLTVHEDTVYWNTNAGLVAAFDSSSGRIRWVSQYPRAAWESSDPDRNLLHFYRDLNPCLVYRGYVIVAPTDCSRLFALDASTGQLLWATPAELAADAVHVIGAIDDRLVVSGECVYSLDVRTGKLLARYPEPFKGAQGFARPEPRGYGRGILAGHDLYWPTREAILVFEMADWSAGEPFRPNDSRMIRLDQPGLSGGNLVLARETLLIAGAERLVALRVKHRLEEDSLP